MKRIMLPIVVVIAAILTLVATVLGWYAWRSNAETASFRPDPSGEIMPGVFALRDDFVDCWFIKGSDGWVAIDTGLDPAVLTANMSRFGIDPAVVKGVLLTHSDYDHADGLAALPGVPVFIGSDEEQMVNGQAARAFIFHNNPLPPHQFLADRQKVSIAGLTFTAINVPGHTPGSVCWLTDDGQLFTGDAISIQEGRMADSSDFFNRDSIQAHKSQDRLRRLKGVTAVFTAHHGHSADPATLFSQLP